jgi:hypothetical protein
VYVWDSPPPKSMASSSSCPQNGHSTLAVDLERPRLGTARLCHEPSRIFGNRLYDIRCADAKRVLFGAAWHS